MVGEPKKLFRWAASSVSTAIISISDETASVRSTSRKRASAADALEQEAKYKNSMWGELTSPFCTLDAASPLALTGRLLSSLRAKAISGAYTFSSGRRSSDGGTTWIKCQADRGAIRTFRLNLDRHPCELNHFLA
jgi:hypothetical protein